MPGEGIPVPGSTRSLVATKALRSPGDPKPSSTQAGPGQQREQQRKKKKNELRHWAQLHITVANGLLMGLQRFLLSLTWEIWF